jgi:hypothetical protein
MNWANIAHAVGDMRNDEEFGKVRVKLPDGRVVCVTDMERTEEGWFLIAADGDPGGQ